MVDKGITDPGKEFYVAPAYPPEARRPPITEVGIIRWLHKNLFASVFDTILTLITFGVVVFVAWNFLSWAIFEAQWEVAFLNQRILLAGLEFPSSELWRPQLLAFIFVFLSLMSVGVWGRVVRGVVIAVIAIIVLFVVLPLMTQVVVEPTVYFYHDSNYKLHQVNFIAEASEEYSFTIDPLTEQSDFAIENIDGYIENDNQQSQTSFDAYNVATNAVNPRAGREQTIDPALYNLSVGIQIKNREGRVVAQSEFTKGNVDSQTFTWSLEGTVDGGEDQVNVSDSQPLPEGWYTFEIVRDEDETYNTEGIAFIEIDNMTVFRSTPSAQQERLEQYGPEPELDCRNCATSVNRTDMRFEGERTVAQWLSLQLAPYVLEIRDFVYLAIIIGAVGYFIGRISRKTQFMDKAMAEPLARRLVQFALIFVVAYLGIWLTQILLPEPVLDTIRIFISVTILFLLFLYALVMFAQQGEGPASRGMSLLWLISIPIALWLLTGFSLSPDAVAAEQQAPLPPIDPSLIGGLLLTVLLSLVAIVISFPIGILLALGRQSNLPVIHLLCTVFIEVVRGVPLITLLFMGTFIVPFFGFGLGDVDLVIRIMVVLTLFTSAYMAEIVRGGLQIVPKGQFEAAYALGLNNFWTTTLIVLPQALRAVIPAIMGQAVSLFKDTTLVYLIGLFDITGVMYQILGDSQTGYLLYPREGFLYLGIIYFLISYMMADISRRVERTGAGAVRRETL